MKRRQTPRAVVPELHIAALPFPSYQGTQAALRSMLESRNAQGVNAELFTYATAGYDLQPSFTLHRAARHPEVGLRSGPSWAKVAADLRMGLALPYLARERGSKLLIAHHVEAMLLAACLPHLPTVFFAHTDLGAELPSYARARYTPLLGAAGTTLDRLLYSRAHAIAAISPALRDRIRASTRFSAQYVPTPWPLAAPIRNAERARARLQLGLAAQCHVALYAGNLDAYQDAELTLDALQELASHGGPRVTLLLATRSQPRHFLQRAISLGVPFRTLELGAEPVRRLAHAAADFAIVPRAVPGGLPMKLLDALARGVPCAIGPLSAAGLPLSGIARAASAPTAAALAQAIAELASHASTRLALAERGRSYIAHEHSAVRFGKALDAVTAAAREEHARLYARPYVFGRPIYALPPPRA
jgi:glycosyltransferase involved in cell wall biosynthesis